MSSDAEVRRQRLGELPEDEAAAALLTALADECWRVRKEAVERLADWPRPTEILPALLGLLDDEADVGARNAALEVLGALGPVALGPLLDARGGSPGRRKFMIDALAAVGDRAALGALAAALADPDENVRAAAAEALGRLGGPEAEAALVAGLGTPGLLGRLAVLEALDHLAVRLPLATVLPLLTEPVLRQAALLALGQTRDPDAAAPLLRALTDRARGVRTSALLGLLALQPADPARLEAAVAAAPPDAVAGLVGALGDEAPRVRRAAATVLGWGRWPEVIAPLAAALLDEEAADLAARALVTQGPLVVGALVALAGDAGQPLRTEVIALLPRLEGAAGHPGVAALLEGALADEDLLVAAAAARALGELGTEAAVGPLLESLERALAPGAAGTGDGPLVAQAVAQALARLGARGREPVRARVAARGLEGPVGPYLCRVLGAVGRPEDRPLLLGALGASDPALRRAAAAALAGLGPAPESVQALIYALADEDAAVRAAAADSLGALGQALAFEPLASAARDGDAQVATAAARALGCLGDRRAAAVLADLAAGPGPVAAAALEALGLIDPARPDLEPFARALARGDAELAKAAVRALARNPTAAALGLLAGALDHARWDVRRLAAQLLAPRAAEPDAAAALSARAAVETEPLVGEVLAAALEARSGPRR